jgi:hypothetical protein
MMETHVDEIANNIFRLSTYTPDVPPSGLRLINHFCSIAVAVVFFLLCRRQLKKYYH